MTRPRPNVAMSILRRVVPGIGRVHAQTAPFAHAWRTANDAALGQAGPLWVALGDSMTQGIGAGAFDGGWVGQLQSRLVAEGRPMRLINLSVTGARIRDVVEHQLPQLQALGIAPDLVTVLIGANDMLTQSRRGPAVAQYRKLLADLPDHVAIVATLPRRNDAALAINALIEDAADRGRIRVADMHSRAVPLLRALRSIHGSLAEDHFHPNEVGYARIADAFARALDLSSPDREPSPETARFRDIQASQPPGSTETGL
jgi:acyl-CoA thioesterase-1